MQPQTGSVARPVRKGGGKDAARAPAKKTPRREKLRLCGRIPKALYAPRRFANAFPAIPKKYSFFSCIEEAKEYFTRIVIYCLTSSIGRAVDS